MTTRKADLRLPSRTPVYVTREIGAAELVISPETWDRWVESGVLPPPVKKIPDGTVRWRWSDVERKLSDEDTEPAANDPFMDGARRMKHGATARRDS